MHYKIKSKLSSGLAFSAIIFSLGIATQVYASGFEPMVEAERGWEVSTVFTVGETIEGTTGVLNPTSAGSYTPPGVLDGLGAYRLDYRTIRVLSNHELLHFSGNTYEVSDGQGGSIALTGARVSYFDIDRYTRQIVDSGLAYNTIYDANGNVATDLSFQPSPFATNFGGAPGGGSPLAGFSRFCSSTLEEPKQFGWGYYRRGFEDRIYFTGEEDGNGFNSVGGAVWALDPSTGDFWDLPDLGRGSWENITQIDTYSRNTVAILLADDTSPFDVNDLDDIAEPDVEAAPLFLYVGTKEPYGDFPARNGLRGGKLYVWVADSGVRSPSEFNGSGKLSGTWVQVDNTKQPDLASEDGSTGYDEFGYPTQRTLWKQAESVGAFGFSRPEDLATNPYFGPMAVLASTGVDTYDVDPVTGNGADTFGTIYTITTSVRKLKGWVRIIYDGDADSSRAIRSPDNLDWADNGRIYIQEDEAEEDTASGDEVLFGEGAANSNEAGIIELQPWNGRTKRIANIDRSVVIDPTIADPYAAIDNDAGDAGEWETSGIIDVSKLFGERLGSLFLFDVQAHGIDDQEEVNPDSRINDGDLVEGGQLLFLSKKNRRFRK